ncbi:MAG: hypothetical protein LIO53_02260 [Oscillospiraceae bacterium]|nr:hypothetical protein [Oscillospiraceae bacterium]
MLKKITIFIAAVSCIAGLATTAMAADYTSNQSVYITDSYIDGDLNIYLINQMPTGEFSTGKGNRENRFDINQNVTVDRTYVNGNMGIYNINDTAFRGDFRGTTPKAF